MPWRRRGYAGRRAVRRWLAAALAAMVAGAVLGSAVLRLAEAGGEAAQIRPDHPAAMG